MKKYLVFSSSWLLLLVFVSCTLPQEPIGSVFPDSTNVYRTVSANLTATGPSSTQFTNTPQFTSSPPVALPSPISTESLKPSPFPSKLPTQATLEMPLQFTATHPPVPCDLAAAGRPSVDISVPDGTRLQPNQIFSKTWRLVNAGTCPWTKDYAIIWFSGEMFSAVREQPFNSTVNPGQSVDITVDMVVPRQAGPHQSNWKLRNARGGLFGIGPAGDAPFWVRIEVEEIATLTATSLPSPTFTPTLGIISKGAFDLPVGKAVDLDTGKLASGAGDDLSLQKLDPGSFQMVMVNGARLADMGMTQPTADDCRAANLQAAAIPAVNLKVGGIWCYRTNQGLPGYLKLTGVSEKDGKIDFDYLTWTIP